MNYSRSFGLLLLILISIAASSVAEKTFLPGTQPAAAAQSQACPKVDISGLYEVMHGSPLTFSVNVTGGDQNVTPTYNWTVSAGTISSGQGTPVITVDTSEAMAGGTITATVEVGGYARNCDSVRSSTSDVKAKPAPARKIGEYGAVKPAEEKTLLDKYATELASDMTTQGFIAAYPGRAGGSKEMQTAVMRALNYLDKNHAIPASRFITVAGAQREKLTIELWVVPAGADSPEVVAPVETKPAKEKPKPASPKPAKPKKS